MNVLVTGGAGYLGSTCVSLLLGKGHKIRVIDSLLHGGQSLLSFWHQSSFDFVFGDIRDRSLLRTALDGIDAVVHLAAIVGDPACARNANQAREVNLQASVSLLEDCRRSKIQKFVFASTCSNYGKMQDPDGYVNEDSELCPLSVYAETKVQAERNLLEADHAEPLTATSLRFATLYGVSPRMRFDLTVNEFTLAMVVKGHLIVFGEQFWRPYVHVRDAARAIGDVLISGANIRGQVFNVGATNQNFRKQDLVEMIRAHAPDACIEYIREKEDPRDYRVCFDKIADRLSFVLTRTVPEGIAEVARLVRSNVVPCFDDPNLRN
ncbi:MAG: NAD(P)-dependent oxidoreductase [Acidobacteriota bacterium]|nr:NAD(P)-dependent oxidoreductase [Acidobacteriota bacterium]